MKKNVRLALAVLLATVIAMAVAGPARADNSNSNTNNNDVTQVGGGDGDDSSQTTDEDTAWPPTGLDWPPSDLLKKDDSDKSGKSSSPPIVMPAGQATPPRSDSPSTTPKVKPIVVAGSP
jgi:hypothetical protein